MIWDTVIGATLKIIDKIIPDPQAKAAAQLEVLKLNQAGELQKLQAETELAMGQLEINKTEAASPNLFVSGWRPGSGWICNVGLAYTFLVQPLGTWLATTRGWIPPPAIPVDDLLVLLGALLGVGTLRSFDKFKGTSR